MIAFKPITLEDKSVYEAYLFDGKDRGCEYSFSNLYLWGQQNATILHDHMVLFSHFNGKTVYPYPVGKGDKKAVFDAIISDAKERNIPLVITGMCEESRKGLEESYPGKFAYYSSKDSEDYVYDINDLADLKGRKYHRKKNHYNRFKKNYPDYRVEPLDEFNLPQVREMIDRWYEKKKEENPEMDFLLEETALRKALDVYQELDMEGLVLICENRVVAVTLGSKNSRHTFDVHFEKAREDVDGVYAAINCEFARYIREKHPDMLFLNREEDMGVEGLRKAKESYYPHHMVQKCWAKLKGEAYEN